MREIEVRYRRLMGLGLDKSLPGVEAKSDEYLADKVAFLERAAARAAEARKSAQPALEALRAAQAEVLSSQDRVSDWLRSAFASWNGTVEDVAAFAPFHHAVKLYGAPEYGLLAATERFDDEERVNFSKAVSHLLGAIPDGFREESVQALHELQGLMRGEYPDRYL